MAGGEDRARPPSPQQHHHENLRPTRERWPVAMRRDAPGWTYVQLVPLIAAVSMAYKPCPGSSWALGGRGGRTSVGWLPRTPAAEVAGPPRRARPSPTAPQTVVATRRAKLVTGVSWRGRGRGRGLGRGRRRAGTARAAGLGALRWFVPALSRECRRDRDGPRPYPGTRVGAPCRSW